jgi:hypothetical protein
MDKHPGDGSSESYMRFVTIRCNTPARAVKGDKFVLLTFIETHTPNFFAAKARIVFGHWDPSSNFIKGRRSSHEILSSSDYLSL